MPGPPTPPMQLMPPMQPMQNTTVLQGQVLVSTDPGAVFTTVLGSCVSSCLFDRTAKIGGINHFLLAAPPANHTAGEADAHYGVYLMELLVTRLLAAGASRQRLCAHLYGGANLQPGMASIGTTNAGFSRSFLQRQGIALVYARLGGVHARRIQFWPTLGKVRCQIVRDPAALEQAVSTENLYMTKRDCDDD